MKRSDIAREELLARVETHLSLLAINRHMEEKVRERSQALLMTEKMATLGTLTAGLAHEFNNPNFFISGAAGNLASKITKFQDILYELVGENPDQEIKQLFQTHFAGMMKQIAMINEGSQRINGVVADMRLFSRLDEAEQKRVDILEGLKACVKMVQSQYEEIRFDLQLGEPILMECRPAELNQVYLNLILNSCLSIRERCQQDEKAEARICIRTRREGNQNVLIFEDSGKGISPENMDHIFEAFFTTRPPGQGTGLGLYTVWRVVENHGGRIEVTSTQDEGTCFSLYFPPNARPA